ncbi:Sister-chromatid cohesion protein 3 [Citrus sinensis]|uniref:Sister-chromatid cohesion protein 3 n=1 Tax=Citrus sinensis TaxID=2711 RepID=A0ACB8ML53_CITSI|nr:Sister-chromatid cohesion protein 3 [Citrus sinensis]KAH9786139.1 Sister-chromatid cohesion protein 3 [Citrus sinensis]
MEPSGQREHSPDDFEEIRPKTKRSRASEGTAASAQSIELSLIEVIKGNGKLIPQVVKLWVERYEKDAKPAIAELLTMLFEACGAKYYLQGESLDEIDVDDVVVALVNLARRGEVEDYQSSKRKELKNFKDNLVSFWDNLVVECQNGPLFDKVLFDKCMDYIIALSCTPPRVYRQVASLMGLQLVTSFISVAKMLGAQRETTQRQLNAEKKKRVEGPRVESLNKRLSMTHKNITDLEDMMRKIFTGLFVHRYRDIDPNIRMSCIQSLGVWILSYPSFFLQDLYLKFSNRMIELADDIDVSVAVCAIGLVKQLLRHQLLPDDDLGPLYDLLIDDPPEIRRAIGELVYDHLIAQKFNSSQSGLKGKDNDSSEVHLGRMLQILREFSADPILSIYVIDDVWEYMKAMKDWKCIISMLLDENPLIDLNDDDATNLIRLLSASVKKAVGERIVPASDNRKPYYNKAQKEVFENNKREITRAMMKNYPRLLRKFMADKAKVPSLIDIVMHMKLELYSLKRDEKSFETILQLVNDAFFKHGEKEALRSCVKAIKFCSAESQGELQDSARKNLKDVEDKLIAKLKSAIKAVLDGDDEYSLLVNLKRLYELQLSKAVPIESLYEDLVMILHTFRNLDNEVVSFLLLNLYLYLAWSLHSIINAETVSEASLASLLLKRNTLFEELEYFLNSPSEVEEGSRVGNQLACRVCTILAEMWCLFRMTNFSSTKLSRLGYCPDIPVLQKFWKLCEQQLNISDETEDEDVNKEYIEETNRDAVMIAAAKLIAIDSVPKAYQRHAVEISRSDDKSLTEKSFVECKELSSRLSGTYVGAARNKHRSDILKTVKEGIDYAFLDAPKQLSFLECAVLHFVSKLPTPDILDILKDVQIRTDNVNMDEDPSGWRPFKSFVETLREKYTKNEGIQEEKEAVTVRRRGRPRKKRNIEGKRLFDEHSSSEEEDSISASDQEVAQDEDDKQEEEEEDEAPLIHSIRSSAKLRALRVSREDNKLQTKTTSGRTSGASG